MLPSNKATLACVPWSYAINHRSGVVFPRRTDARTIACVGKDEETVGGKDDSGVRWRAKATLRAPTVANTAAVSIKNISRIGLKG